jgi:hypothetical protein
MRDGENPMIIRMLQLGRLAALLLVVGFAFGAAPASAGCYNDCYAPSPIVVEPQPVYYQSCGTCCGGCGSSYYMSYYPAYSYPAAGCGGCGGGYAGYGYGGGYAGYGYGGGYGYAGAVAAGVVGAGFYRRGYIGRRYWR